MIYVDGSGKQKVLFCFFYKAVVSASLLEAYMKCMYVCERIVLYIHRK